MDELIKKQDAIDVLRTCYDTETISMDNGDEYINYGDAVGGIEQLSSAQPIYTDAEIQKMQDLESAQIEKAYQLGYEDGKKDTQPDFDIDQKINKAYDDGYDQGYLQCKADQERTIGHWIERRKKGSCYWQSWCSVCGKHSGIGGIESNRHKLFCPNCGSRMSDEVEWEI